MKSSLNKIDLYVKIEFENDKSSIADPKSILKTKIEKFAVIKKSVAAKASPEVIIQDNNIKSVFRLVRTYLSSSDSSTIGMKSGFTPFNKGDWMVEIFNDSNLRTKTNDNLEFTIMFLEQLDEYTPPSTSICSLGETAGYGATEIINAPNLMTNASDIDIRKSSSGAKFKPETVIEGHFMSILEIMFEQNFKDHIISE